MDKICDLRFADDILKFINQAKNTSPGLLLIILGPTASGKTKLAVNLAKQLDGEIISADSRQVYRRLNIGTGKDLLEYDSVPYHLIDVLEPTKQYTVNAFITDFKKAYQEITQKNKLPILCGGTGSYIHSLLKPQKYSQIPKNEAFHKSHQGSDNHQLIQVIKSYNIPEDFKIDWANHKRLIRALEILQFIEENGQLPEIAAFNHPYLIIGLNPTPAERAQKIEKRLTDRVQNQGMIEEVQDLISSGITHEELQWLGLEYKYTSLYLLGELNYTEYLEKLTTEIKRYAKRQMTYFRKMEKDGIKINWMNP